MKMKYFGYALVLLAFLAGYVGYHSGIILILALISAAIYASSRRKALRRQPQAPDKNMLLDGFFLLFGQMLIMFTAYILAWFLVNKIAVGAL